jgi:hypothetical protein
MRKNISWFVLVFFAGLALACAKGAVDPPQQHSDEPDTSDTSDDDTGGGGDNAEGAKSW